VKELETEDRDLLERKKRKTERILIVITVLVVLILTVVEANIASTITKIPFLGNVFVFIVINLNIILILFLLYLVSRNFFKLFVERKRNILGSKIRYKLVVTFLVFSVIPMVLLFFLSYKMTRSSIKTYIGSQVGEGMESSIVIAREYIALQERLMRDYLVFFDERRTSVERVTTPDGLWSPDFVARTDGTAINLLFGREGDYGVDEFLIYVSERPGENLITHTEGKSVFGALKGPNASYLVAVKVIPGEIYGGLSKVSSAFKSYSQIRILTDPIRATNLGFLIMITLIIIFTNTWIGFYLARDFSVPLKKLAEGTERLSGGREPVVIEYESNDEFGLLVDSFNRMAKEIVHSRVELEKLNRELKNSYNELFAKAEIIEAIITIISTGVITLDKTGKITTINQVAKDILGIDGDVEGQRYRDLFSRSEYEVMRKGVGGLEPEHKETMEKNVRTTIGGTKKELIVRAAILKTAKKEYQGVVVTIDDITDIKRMQQIMAWGDVAKKVAHEIKNPLTPINLSAQRLKKKFFGQISKDGHVFEECVETIISEVEIISQLVDEFYRFARMPETKREEGDVVELGKQIIGNYRELYPDIEFSFVIDGPVPKLNFDQAKLKRVFVNLLENSLWAVRQRESKGAVLLAVEHDRERGVVKMKMEDNGIGIPDGDHEKIFDLYYSSKEGGKGLGLSIVKAIVDEHGGKVYSDRGINEGTKIIFELPV
jgi:two-component system nitrogen regulation sensor histidine kinase NtrY